MRLSEFIIAFVVLFISLSSCVSGQSDEAKAEERLQKIEQLIDEYAYNSAKSEIDSIHLLYPRMVDKRRTAQTYMDTIVRRESTRSIAYCDSMLQIKQEKAKAMEVNFKFEKDEKYQNIGSYVHRSLRTELNAGRNFLKIYIDELANIYMTSYYSGAKLNQTQLTASFGNSFAETAIIPTSNSSNYSFTDNGQRWEMLTFKNEETLPVIEFVNQYADKQVKITLKGDKNYSYILSPQDKKAIAESYNFWIEKKDISLLEKEIKKAESRIAIIKDRYLSTKQ